MHLQNSTHATQNTNIKLRLTWVVEAADMFPCLRWGPGDSYGLTFPFGGNETNM